MAGTSVAGQPGIVGVLNREWVELVRDHQQTTARWVARHDALRGCRSFDDLLAAARTDADPVLAALLAEVATGDRWAGRVILQVLIGRMVAMAARDARGTVDEYLSAVCCRIFTYDLDARPRFIAANLSMDALQLVSAERRWNRYREVIPWPVEAFAEEHLSGEREGGDRLEGSAVLAAGCRLRLITPGAADLLDVVYLQARDRGVVARERRLSASTIRVRCHRALAVLARHADVLREAC